MDSTAETTTVSLKLSELPLHQLVQLSQGVGHQIDQLREQRAHLKRLIAVRLAVGERESVSAAEGDATAPGAVIVASAAA